MRRGSTLSAAGQGDLFESEAFPAGAVAGVDEAGRGPLCGPVTAAAGILDGMGDGRFAPQGTMTREQALKVAVVCLQNLG